MEFDGELRNVIARIAQEVVGGKQFKGTLVCTGYRKDIHAVKGILVPHGIETSWVALAAIHVGNGYGIVIGPKVGDPQKLDGDQFDIEFDLGSPNSIVAKHKQFSSQEKPPPVEPGEILVQHESGNKVFMGADKSLLVQHHTGNHFVFNEDKSMVWLHADTQSNITITKTGDHIHDARGRSVTIKNTSGLHVDGDLNVSGVSALTSGTLGGLPIATS